MYYNLKEFGKEVRKMRNDLQLTQKEVSGKSCIHVDTLRKIESGKVLATQETLELLSPILKTDLNTLLLKHRLNNYSDFTNIKNKIEVKIDKNEYKTLTVDLEDLNKLLDIETNTYFVNLLNQLKLLIESIMLNKDENKTKESLDKLIQAMIITSPEFTLEKYKKNVYNSMEIRILMNMALLINKIETTEKSLEILSFCFDIIDPSKELYPKICYNLSYAFHRTGRHVDALKYADLGIRHCETYRNFNGLNHLYFRKGIAEYLLAYNEEIYSASLRKCLDFCEMLNQNELKRLVIENCREIYNIIL